MTEIERQGTELKCTLDWDNQTVFKDAVLGYINAPKAVVNLLIDHKIFQRLHDVAQTGMETLYPGATHNRFCHSIGVYHLGKLAFQCFQQNVKNQHPDDVYFQVAANREACERVWNRWRLLFECACLLHDCGHSPLSHSLEFLYDSIETRRDDGTWVNRGSDRILLEDFKGNEEFVKRFYKRDDREKNSGNAYGAQHERMSAHLVINICGYRSQLKTLIKDQMLHFDSRPESIQAVENYDEEQLQSDLEFMVRTIIGYPYSSSASFLGEEKPSGDLIPNQSIIFQLRNCIIRLLNGIIDVDNIDYSVRDASASGYKSAQVDYERLLKAETIALAYDQGKMGLVVEGERFDHSVRLLKFESDEIKESDHPLTMTISGSATLFVRQKSDSSGKIVGNLEITGNIIEDDEKSTKKKDVRVIHIQDGSNVRIKLTAGSLEIRPRTQDENKGTQIYLRSDELHGRIFGVIFVGSDSSQLKDEGVRKLLDKIRGGGLKIYPAYHKSALSVIQGALDAANFESRWIYSHHVTTYNNNFLSVFLLEKCAEYLFDKEYSNLFEQLALFLKICKSFADKETTVDVAKLKQCFENAQNGIREIRGRAPELAKVCLYDRDYCAGKCPEVIYVLLELLCVLCRKMPVEERENGLKQQFSSAVTAVIKTINTYPLTGSPESKPLQYEKVLYDQLKQVLIAHEGFKMGMATMSALLGMPDAQRVNGKVFYRSSDADLRSMYHSLFQNASSIERTTHQDFFSAIEQYESRQYLSPMWKSHAEFHFYTQGWKESWFHPQKTLERKSSIDTLSLIDNFFSETTTPYDPKDQENHRSLYIYFSNEAVQSYSIKLQKFWKAVSDKFGMDILVYVPQKIRHKKLEDDDTYVVWKNRIVTMKDIGFHVSHDAGESYFYLYYKLRSNHEGDLDVSEFMEFMKSYLEEEEEAASAAMTLGQY